MKIVARLLALAFAFAAAPVSACTLCHSRLADEVRAAIFGPGFWADAGAVVSPIPLLLAAVFAVRRYLL